MKTIHNEYYTKKSAFFSGFFDKHTTSMQEILLYVYIYYIINPK